MSLIVLVVVFVLVAAVVAGAAAWLTRPGGGRGVRGIGLAPTLALVVLAAGCAVLAALALVVDAANGPTGLDTRVADWAGEHTTGVARDVLNVFTSLGKPGVAAALAVILAVVATVRTHNRWIAPFLLLVVAGNGIVTTTIKHLADRVRPEIDPIAATLGPSFPSGHSSWSAAFLAAAALVLAAGHGRRATVLLAGLAAGLAAAIGASRVLLGVHWLTDVLAGLALGWAWFAACAIAFGGRLLGSGATSAQRAAHGRLLGGADRVRHGG